MRRTGQRMRTRSASPSSWCRTCRRRTTCGRSSLMLATNISSRRRRGSEERRSTVAMGQISGASTLRPRWRTKERVTCTSSSPSSTRCDRDRFPPRPRPTRFRWKGNPRIPAGQDPHPRGEEALQNPEPKLVKWFKRLKWSGRGAAPGGRLPPPRLRPVRYLLLRPIRYLRTRGTLRGTPMSLRGAPMPGEDRASLKWPVGHLRPLGSYRTNASV
mmetsp:Transcript_2332/g.5539  ORF Transcript_2332/g.5539 Transcript_2332/m.5539 type:complete len:215 (+) Transcript_2332:161-805(+)